MPKYRFMISGGGTGGHIFPAIAIADKLKEIHPDAEFLFVGARDRMEMERVPQAGYDIEGLWISGIQRKLTATNLMFPFKLFSSITKCKKLIKKFKPDVVIGTGGFASGPLLYVAAKKGIPTLIQEQNSLPGITNKILASKVNSICVAYDNMESFFPKSKILLTGNPIRSTVKNVNANRSNAIANFNLKPERPTLLILGGSLGARRINEFVGDNLEALLEKGINILWQTGKLYIDELKSKYGASEGDQMQIVPFIKNMEDAYAADVVISRAGAGTISELAVAQKATMLIPSPNVAEDHQTKNANALAEKGAAILFRESGSNEEFLGQVSRLIGERPELEKHIKEFALPDAADAIAKQVLTLAEKHA